MLSTEQLKRSVQTLQASLHLYGQSAADTIEREVFRSAIIKSYELVQEMSFTLLRKALLEFGYSNNQLKSLPIKEIVRLAATHQLVTLEAVERWFAYRDNRNNTAHEYGETFVHETLGLLPSFIADVQALVAALDQLGQAS